MLRLALAAACGCAPAAAQAGDDGIALVSPEALAMYVDPLPANADLSPQRRGGDDPAGASALPAKRAFSDPAFLWQPPTSFDGRAPVWGTPGHRRLALAGSRPKDAKVVRLALTTTGKIGGHELAATIAGFSTAESARSPFPAPGGMLGHRPTRGIHPHLPSALGDAAQPVRPRYGHPLLALDPGPRRRAGVYGRVAWTAPAPVHVEVLHYDNNGDRLAANSDREWGWRTSFNALGVVADLGHGFGLRAQALSGRTRMGDRIGGRDWIDMRFRAASAMATRRFARSALSARLDLFATRNHGSAIDIAEDENGWAVTLAAKRQFAQRVTLAAEYLHVESDRAARVRSSPAPRQLQNQVQMVLRAVW